jgi:glucose/arabinose dehydrogenase
MKKLTAVLLASALALAACAAPGAASTPLATSPAVAISPPAAANTPAVPTTAASPALTTTSAATTLAAATGAPPTATTLSAAASTTVPPGAIDPARYIFTAVAQGFKSPLLVTNAGDGSGRLFVVEQGGLIRVVQNGAILPQPFIDLTNLVTHGGSEEGLLGLAFDPHYTQSGQFYVYYTDVNGDIHLARYHVTANDPNQADAGSAQNLLTVAHHTYPNHNGGNLVFGPDGYLYVSVGDGGSQGDPNGNGQNLGVLLAKILRLDVSGGGSTYSIPPSNPFVGKSGAKGEIWVYGVRNPWRATFDRATGDFWIGDVGQDTYEEVDLQPAGDKGGEDYGWNYMEALHPYQGQAPAGLTLTAPVAEYSHQEGGCSVTGGYVYRGPSLPELAGVYFFGDYCSGIVWTLVKTGDQWQRAKFVSSGFTISSFGQDEAGELYVCDYGGGVIYRLARAP